MATLIAVSSILSGCEQKRNIDSFKRIELIKFGDLLYSNYLNGSVIDARMALTNAICLWDTNIALLPMGREVAISLGYARLYVLDARIGNSDEAEADLIQERYWHLKALEKDKLPLKEIIQEIHKFDTNYLMQMVSQNDRANNKGNDPIYFKDELVLPTNARRMPTENKR